jgi:hypothetical protein
MAKGFLPFYLFAFLPLFSSCVDTLILPDNKTVDEDYWQTKGDVQTLVAAAYAQLRDEYYDGFAYWFDKSEEERMTQQNEYFRIVSDEEQLIRCRFRKPKPGEPFKRLNSATIAQMISYGRQPITSRRVSLVMKAIGFKSERNSKGCYYKLYEMDTNESQRVISDMVAEPKKEEPQQPDLFETSDDLPF